MKPVKRQSQRVISEAMEAWTVTASRVDMERGGHTLDIILLIYSKKRNFLFFRHTTGAQYSLTSLIFE